MLSKKKTPQFVNRGVYTSLKINEQTIYIKNDAMNLAFIFLPSQQHLVNILSSVFEQVLLKNILAL